MATDNLRPVFLAGPTGSGKSAVALALAALTGGEIVCADPFQCYRGLEILTAQPAADDLAAVPHRLYGAVDPSEEMDAARFAAMAGDALADIRARGRLAIVCGGSGLYLKALTHGLSPLPPGDPALRRKLEALPVAELAAKLAALDPASAAQLNPRNPRHLVRAIEICLLTGQPASALRQSWAAPRPGVRGVILTRDRADLYARIDRRTSAMVETGVVDEVARLDPDRLSATAARAIGLWEFRAVADGSAAAAEAVATVRQATRNYAKRQLTWFRRESALAPVPADPRTPPPRSAAEIVRLLRLPTT